MSRPLERGHLLRTVRYFHRWFGLRVYAGVEDFSGLLGLLSDWAGVMAINRKKKRGVPLGQSRAILSERGVSMTSYERIVSFFVMFSISLV